jgi:hypothetical protein
VNHLATLSAAENECVLWNLRKDANSIEVVLRRTSNGLELRYNYNGKPGHTLEYWDAVQLVNDAEDYHAELLAAGWSAHAVLPPRADKPARKHTSDSEL